jgi:hypothetical protein
MIKLHNKLCSPNSSRDDVILGGFNILFLGDFLQLPSVSPYHLTTCIKRTIPIGPSSLEIPQCGSHTHTENPPGWRSTVCTTSPSSEDTSAYLRRYSIAVRAHWGSSRFLRHHHHRMSEGPPCSEPQNASSSCPISECPRHVFRRQGAVSDWDPSQQVLQTQSGTQKPVLL